MLFLADARILSDICTSNTPSFFSNVCCLQTTKMHLSLLTCFFRVKSEILCNHKFHNTIFTLCTNIDYIKYEWGIQLRVVFTPNVLSTVRDGVPLYTGLRIIGDPPRGIAKELCEKRDETHILTALGMIYLVQAPNFQSSYALN